MKILGKKHFLIFSMLTVFSFVVVVCNVLQPLIAQKLLDTTLAGEYGDIAIQFVYLFSAIITLLVFEMCRKLLTANYKKHVLDSLRYNVLSGLLSKPLEDFQLLNNQKYLSLFNNDLKEITEDYYVQFTEILFNMMSLVVYSAALFSLNYIMAVIVIVTNILPILAPIIFEKKLQLKRSEYLESLKNYNVKLGDIVNGFAIVKVHRMRIILETFMRKESSDSTNRQRSFEYVNSFSEMLVGLLSFANYFCIILAGIYLMTKNQLSAGGLLAAIQVSELMVGPTVSITYQMNSFNAIKAIKRNLFKEYGDSVSRESKSTLDKPVQKITVENLGFKYGEVPALSDINLCFEAHKKYLIYGHSGSGKSTLFKILSKMNREYDGKVLVNGISLDSIDETDYFSRIGIVYQTPFMFNDTLLNNITLYGEYEEIKIRELISELDLERIEADIFGGKSYKDSENNISGGEKQKISLARILLEEKKFIFLDEATSSIDVKSSSGIEYDLLSRKDITLVNIEHKINADFVKLYDEIVCLEDGKVVKIIKSDEDKDEFLEKLRIPV